jgi:hypothetical protein
MRIPALSILVTFSLACILPAQSPVIVQAAPPAAALKTQTQTQVAAPNADAAQALKMLQQMKAANEETLRKQAATLEQLDELDKAANQIRIFSSRN